MNTFLEILLLFGIAMLISLALILDIIEGVEQYKSFNRTSKEIDELFGVEEK